MCLHLSPSGRWKQCDFFPVTLLFSTTVDNPDHIHFCCPPLSLTHSPDRFVCAPLPTQSDQSKLLIQGLLHIGTLTSSTTRHLSLTLSITSTNLCSHICSMNNISRRSLANFFLGFSYLSWCFANSVDFWDQKTNAQCNITCSLLAFFKNMVGLVC